MTMESSHSPCVFAPGEDNPSCGAAIPKLVIATPNAVPAFKELGYKPHKYSIMAIKFMLETRLRADQKCGCDIKGQKLMV